MGKQRLYASYSNVDDDDERRFDERAIQITRLQNLTWTDEEARSTAMYYAVKTALREAYLDGADYGMSTCGYSE